MNKYIESDISDGIKSIKIGLMNAIGDVLRDEIDEIIFKKHIPVSLVLECCKEFKIPKDNYNEYLSNWKIEYDKLTIFGIFNTGYLKITYDRNREEKRVRIFE